MSGWSRFRRVIWPTMLRLAWPAYTNEAIFMFHATTLVFFSGFPAWQQRGDELELEINGRLGIGRALIGGNESRLTVDARGETEVLTDPEQQLSDMLGWWLPVTSAEYWLLGRPEPDYPAQTSRGRYDTLATLTQREWQLSYDEYQLTEGRLVPRHITMTYAPLELSLRIIEWRSAVTEP